MPERKPRTKAPKGEQLGDTLQGDLAVYDKVGLFQHAVNSKTAYRYRGCLLHYQAALQGNPPSVESTKMFLGHLREQKYSASTLRVFRAALKGFHTWKGENFDFTVKVPHHKPKYTEASTITKMLELAKDHPRDYLIILLLSDAGLRRDEAVRLEACNVGEKALRIRGKEDKDRTVPMTQALLAAIKPFCEGKKPHDLVVGCKEKAIYQAVKKYGKLAGKSEIKPHDLRHAFATRLMEKGVSISVIQELLGHADLGTTQIYISVTGVHLEEAIHALDPNGSNKEPDTNRSSHTEKNNSTDSSKEMVATFDEQNPLTDSHSKDDRSSIPPYQETSHKLNIREAAKTMGTGISIPVHGDKDLWKDLPIEFQPGRYNLPIGVVDLGKGKQTKVKYHDLGVVIGEEHLRKALYDHLRTSGWPRFTELVADNGKLANLGTEIEQYSRALLEFLKLIREAVEKSGVQINLGDENKTGLTKWFILTAWNDTLTKAGGATWITDSWYRYSEPEAGSNLWRLKCGAYEIGNAHNRKTLVTFEKSHKKIRLTFTENKLAKKIADKNKKLGENVQAIKQLLREFSDLEQLPGRCELCINPK
jgi:integrase/recombinase XerD